MSAASPLTLADPAPVAAMPFEQDDLLRIAPEYLRLQADGPISRALSPVGDPCWLVTGYDEVKRLIADPRVGRAHREPKQASRISQSLLLGGPVGDFDTEHELHEQVRRLLQPAFTARRTALLGDYVAERTHALMGELAGRPGPIDLHQQVSFELPLLVICSILGLPEDSRPRFADISHRIAESDQAGEAAAALVALVTFMVELIETKRTELADDLISDLIRGGEREQVAAQTLSFVAASLLFAGHETIASRIDFGLLLLLENPAALTAIRTGAAEWAGCVEEILRLATPNDLGQARYARADLEVGGVRIREGDALVLAIGAANRDPKVFTDPERFDITRSPNPHLSFGFGKHFCLGAALARLELGIVFDQLFGRFPDLRLAIPKDQLRLQESQVTGGIVALPIDLQPDR